MKKKIIVEIAEGLGNQFFMYAHAYSMAKKLNYELCIDNKSGYSLNKNIIRSHQNYILSSFNIKQNYVFAIVNPEVCKANMPINITEKILLNISKPF